MVVEWEPMSQGGSGCLDEKQPLQVQV
jgi:hypothetical protein